MSQTDKPNDNQSSPFDPLQLQLLAELADISNRQSQRQIATELCDIAQDVALAVCEGRVVKNFKPNQGSLRSFAKAAVQNFKRTRSRSEARYAKRMATYQQFKNEHSAAVDAVDGTQLTTKKELIEEIRDALSQLSPGERAAVTRYYWGESCPNLRAVVSESHLEFLKSGCSKLRQLLRNTYAKHFLNSGLV